MIGMGFFEFLTLLVISIIVSAILHYGLKFYIVPGITSLSSKIVIGWIGAWLGSPVFGYWFEGVCVGEVFIIPAILGCVALILLVVDGVKSCSAAWKE